MLTKIKYYIALSNWNGRCAVGKHLINYFKIEDNEIKMCDNDKKSLKLFLKRHVKEEKTTRGVINEKDIKSCN